MSLCLRALTAGLALCSAAVFAQNGKTEVLWLGQAATRITTPTGKVIMIDPWLTSNPKTPAGYKVLVKITAVHAEHSSELAYKNAATGKDEVHPGGEPVGFIIEMENGFKVWHMGDTGVFGDMRLIGDMYRPDLVLIPIGGHFVMPPADAAMVVRDMIKPKFALPIHYGTTPQLRGTPAEFEAALGKAPGTPRMLVVQPGEKVDF
ncbi:MAG: hypothetical protein B7Y42_05275 [Polaromonas sp. 28-63-22]|nr:MAG: hypothetical protein B7Y42_05275 [Polaromonas sp. 28-63-22]